MRNWEQEKAYCSRKADELTAEMKAAIENSDKEKFMAAYQTAKRYMTKKQLHPLYVEFLRKELSNERNEFKACN